MTAKPTTVTQYLASLDPDRKKALQAIRKVVKANLDPKVKEGIQYGMIGYFIPHSVYPDGYHCSPEQPLPFMSIASQKNHMAVYLFCIYGDEAEAARFEKQWAKSGKKLDMGKSCVRFKKIEDVCLTSIGAAVKRMTAARFIKHYEANVVSATARKKKAASKKAAAKKKPARKAATRKATTGKKAAARTSKSTASSAKKKATPRTTARKKRS
jgi:uncharacterized protein YdhG (YjbR/CyaY superfamily)